MDMSLVTSLLSCWLHHLSPTCFHPSLVVALISRVALMRHGSSAAINLVISSVFSVVLHPFAARYSHWMWHSVEAQVVAISRGNQLS